MFGLNSFKSGKFTMSMFLSWDSSLLVRKEKGMTVIAEEREKIMCESVCFRQVMGESYTGYGKCKWVALDWTGGLRAILGVLPVDSYSTRSYELNWPSL